MRLWIATAPRPAAFIRAEAVISVGWEEVVSRTVRDQPELPRDDEEDEGDKGVIPSTELLRASTPPASSNSPRRQTMRAWLSIIPVVGDSSTPDSARTKGSLREASSRLR